MLRRLRRDRPIFLSALGISCFWLYGAVALSLFPVLVRETLGAHEAVVTLFLVCFCVGTAAGSLLTERLSRGHLELGLVPVGSLAMTAFTLDLFFALGAVEVGVDPAPGGVLSFLARDGSWRVLVDLVGLAVAGGLFTVPLYTLLQQRADPAERSRIVAGNNIANAFFMVVGAVLLAGLLATGADPRLALLALAALSAVGSIALYALIPEFLLRFAAFVVARVLYRIDVRGHENIPKEGPVVLVANHISFVDWLVLGGSVRRPPRFVMDHRIARTPIVGRLFRDAKTIPIASARDDADTMERAFERIREELRDGQVVCIFPEGKITYDGEMDRFRTGIERIVQETPVPVVPIALGGLWGSIWSRDGGGALRHLPRRFRARLRIVIGRAVPASDVTAAGLEADVRALLVDAGSVPGEQARCEELGAERAA